MVRARLGCGHRDGRSALNLGAKVLVATLETQRARFLRRDGPRLLVVDEYQMIADPVRGVHYELALAQLQPLTKPLFDEIVVPLLPEITGGEITAIATRGGTIYARIDFSAVQISAVVDSHGCALFEPPEREAIPIVCRACSQLEHDLTAIIANSPAYAWRQLGLVTEDGAPTLRGTLFPFFQAGEGLAIAAALEDETYPIDDLAFDLANIRAGPRFAGEDAPLGGRLGILCQRTYGRRSSGLPGNGSACPLRLRRIRSDSRTGYHPIDSLPDDDRITPLGRYRARAHGMAQPAPAHRGGTAA